MPVKSEKQRKFFGAELRRKKQGKKGMTNMSIAQLEEYLKKSKSKKLSKKKKRKTKKRI
jgi:hypothetical protein